MSLYALFTDATISAVRAELLKRGYQERKSRPMVLRFNHPRDGDRYRMELMELDVGDFQEYIGRLKNPKTHLFSNSAFENDSDETINLRGEETTLNKFLKVEFNSIKKSLETKNYRVKIVKDTA